MKLEDLLNLWLDKYVKDSVKIRTYNRYKDICNSHLKVYLGGKDINQLKLDVLQNYVSILIKHNYSTNTIKGIISVLKQSLHLAVQLELIEKEYTSLIRLPQINEKQISFFNKNEQEKLITFCINNKNKNYIGIVICLLTGIRLGELLALTWNDIDFENKILKINKTVFTTKIENHYKQIIDTPKTKKSVREIPLSNNLIEVLKNIKNKSKSKYIITTKKLGIVSNRSYQRTFKFILKKNNIPYKNFHALRHTFATNAVNIGMDVKSIADILGHSNVMITVNRYAHSFLDYKIQMMNKLDNQIFNTAI